MGKLKFLVGTAFAATLLAALPARAEIVIGLIAPLTGAVAAYGDQVRNGAEAAVEAINKKGGILGEKVVLKLADDAGDPKQGVSAANLLVGEKIKFVVGPGTSGVAMAVSDVLAEHGVLGAVISCALGKTDETAPRRTDDDRAASLIAHHA